MSLNSESSGYFYEGDTRRGTLPMSLAVGIKELISSGDLQKLQDLLAGFLDLGLLITDTQGTTVTKASNTRQFCTVTRQSAKGRLGCSESDKRGGGIVAIQTGQINVYTCHAGLMEFAAPILLAGECIGSIVGGQVRPDTYDEETLRETAASYGIDPDVYAAEAEKIRRMSEKRLGETAQVLSEIFSIFFGIACDRYLTLGESRKIISDTQTQSEMIMKLNHQLRQKLQFFTEGTAPGIPVDNPQAEESGKKEFVRQTSALSGLVDDTLDYLHFPEEEYALNETTYEVQHVIENEIRRRISMNPELKERIRCEVSSHVPFYLLGDPGCIGQIESRILDFGLRRSESDEVLITVDCRQESYATVLLMTFLFRGSCLTMADEERVAAALRGDSGDLLIREQEYDLLGISVAARMVRVMAGKINAVNINRNSYAFHISVPQLGTKGYEF